MPASWVRGPSAGDGAAPAARQQGTRSRPGALLATALRGGRPAHSLELACICPARFSEGVGHPRLNTAHQGQQEGGESTGAWNPDPNFERPVCVAPSGALAKELGWACMSYELPGGQFTGWD